MESVFMDIDLKNFLLNDSLEGIIVTDMEGNILQFNRTAQKMLRYNEIDLLEQFIGFIFPPKSVSYLLPNLLHLARAAGGFDGDIILQDSAGDKVMVRMIAQAWPEEDPSLLLLRFLDWRETHEIMTRLRESNQLASLGTLTRSLSHEILNPVTIIGGNMRRILDSLEPDSKAGEWAHQVMESVEKLESMVGAIRTFVELPSPSLEKLRTGDLLEDSLVEIEADAEKLGVRITRDRITSAPHLFMDPDLMGKAFSAVLLNAMDRMPGGGEIALGVSHDENHCQVVIEDNGPALDTWQMEEDMSPIHVIRAHKTHLNLAIAKRIVDDHGGSFDVGKSRSDGLKVRITLPRDRRALAREREM